MSCWCGSREPKKLSDAEKEFIREKRENVELRLLDEANYTFDAKSGEWIEGIGRGMKSLSRKKKYENEEEELKYLIEEKNREIDKLEKQYLSSIVKLLVLTQIHCDVKSEINEKFDEYGVSTIARERSFLQSENGEQFDNTYQNNALNYNSAPPQYNNNNAYQYNNVSQFNSQYQA